MKDVDIASVKLTISLVVALSVVELTGCFTCGLTRSASLTGDVCCCNSSVEVCDDKEHSFIISEFVKMALSYFSYMRN